LNLYGFSNHAQAMKYYTLTLCFLFSLSVNFAQPGGELLDPTFGDAGIVLSADSGALNRMALPI